MSNTGSSDRYTKRIGLDHPQYDPEVRDLLTNPVDLDALPPMPPADPTTFSFEDGVTFVPDFLKAKARRR